MVTKYINYLILNIWWCILGISRCITIQPSDLVNLCHRKTLGILVSSEIAMGSRRILFNFKGAVSMTTKCDILSVMEDNGFNNRLHLFAIDVYLLSSCFIKSDLCLAVYLSWPSQNLQIPQLLSCGRLSACLLRSSNAFWKLVRVLFTITPGAALKLTFLGNKTQDWQ